jgi:SAM-dependent MidA family methyltransferase
MFVARALAGIGDGLPRSDESVRIVEVGAGDGTLARQVLAAGIGRPCTYAAEEVSAGARRALEDMHGLVVQNGPLYADLVLAHELLDNLPFRLVRGGREVRVDVRGDRLVERLVPVEDDLGAAIGGQPVDGELVVPVGALGFVERLAAELGDGAALLIDYGDEGTGGGPAHGYRDHRLVGDLLGSPGATDITAGVDFRWIAKHAAARGLEVFGPVTQRRALLALGFETWHSVELEEQHAHLREGRGLEAVRTWSGRSRSTMLVDPASLGRFRWLVLAGRGVAEPAWIAEAR